MTQLIHLRKTSAYSSSGNSGKILVEVVIGSRQCSCTLSKDSHLLSFVIPAIRGGVKTYLAGIPTKRCDILLHPLKSGPLVVQTEVEDSSLHSLWSLREAQRSKTVVNRHIQDWRSL